MRRWHHFAKLPHFTVDRECMIRYGADVGYRGQNAHWLNASEGIARRTSLSASGPPTRQGSSGLLFDLRNEILPAAVALLAATMASGCGSEPTCAETATCPPYPVDAPIHRDATDVLEAGSNDDAADISIDQDAADRADRSDAASSIDASKEADGTSADVASADRRVSDASDALADQAPDTAIDVTPCNADAGRSPTDNPCIVSERYGVFVSPSGSDASGAGTRSAPFRTLSRALQAAKAETMRVFACDNGAGYTDPVTIDATLDGLAVYGGFECAGWTLVANARTRVRPAAGPALTIAGVAAGAIFENFELQAADAAVGTSSIAVQVHASLQVVFRNSRIVAGRGGAGQAGADGAAGKDGEPSGRDQRGQPASCRPPIVSQAGGVALAGACGSKGGNGGACETMNGSLPGESGIPLTGVDPPNQPNGGTFWIHDRMGKKGSDGVAGLGGTANSKAGSFSATGYTLAPPGGDGADGNVAQGGGGGSAGEPDQSNRCICASGGAGGMGGCGGVHGTGGGAGGASVALLSWASGITLDKCELISGDGGPGGTGGNGGRGGKGSEGAEGGEGQLDYDAGPSLLGGGPGGPGGSGGPGGAGAGGNGGPTYGIVYAGGRPSQIGGTTVARGSGGLKGIGGFSLIGTPPDGGIADGGAPEGGPDGGLPDGGFAGRAADGVAGEAAYELAIP
jgi:hypothetical protein